MILVVNFDRNRLNIFWFVNFQYLGLLWFDFKLYISPVIIPNSWHRRTAYNWNDSAIKMKSITTYKYIDIFMQTHNINKHIRKKDEQ